MKNRMNVPQEYEPVLPDKVKAIIEKQEASAAAGRQTIWYQCIDDPNSWALGGHKSHKQAGVLSVDVVLLACENEGALMITFEDNRRFVIKDGAMVPAENRVFEIDNEALKSIIE